MSCNNKGDFLTKNFYNLRNECLKRKVLFEDPEFPIYDFTIHRNDLSSISIEWRRPGEICEVPQLFVEGVCRFDINQGKLGDCWMLAAMVNLTMHDKLFNQVVPDDQGFEPERYAGIFHFKFWQCGRWVDVVIDDCLPTHQGKLVYLSSTVNNEFWSALLEKAYAKLYGSYESLAGGFTNEAMEDFTGGIGELYDVQQYSQNLFEIMTNAFDHGSLICADILASQHDTEDKTNEGLVTGHAFSVTGAKLMTVETPQISGKVKMLRIRNPWGNGWEWRGCWSDFSTEWEFVPQSEKNDMEVHFMKDGEFWMPYIDFVKHFSLIEVCNLMSVEGYKEWKGSCMHGAWKNNVSAGGSVFYTQTFHLNPQFTFNIDHNEDSEVIIALMQKHFRYTSRNKDETVFIGYAIYKLNNNEKLPLKQNFFESNYPVAHSSMFIMGRYWPYLCFREITTRFKLEPGLYCIIPSTKEPNCSQEFLLRMFTKQKPNLKCVKA